MLKKDYTSQHEAASPVRRPLVVRIAQDLRLQHPNWAEDEIMSEAKAQTIAQLQGKETIAA